MNIRARIKALENHAGTGGDIPTTLIITPVERAPGLYDLISDNRILRAGVPGKDLYAETEKIKRECAESGDIDAVIIIDPVDVPLIKALSFSARN
jgi:hypothetical protein